MSLMFHDREEWRNADGKLHRDGDLPAVEYDDGSKEWWIDGKLHRENGPAVIYSDGSCYWYLNGHPFRDFNGTSARDMFKSSLQRLQNKRKYGNGVNATTVIELRAPRLEELLGEIITMLKGK